jgi:predicted amidohydrolase YtcJ
MNCGHSVRVARAALIPATKAPIGGNRIEHNALITTAQIRRAKALGFELSFVTYQIEVLGTWIAGQPVDIRKASLTNLLIAGRALR